MAHDPKFFDQVTGTRISYQKRGQNRTCAIASNFLIRDSGTGNLDAVPSSCAMGLRLSVSHAEEFRCGGWCCHVTMVTMCCWRCWRQAACGRRTWSNESSIRCRGSAVKFRQKAAFYTIPTSRCVRSYIRSLSRGSRSKSFKFGKNRKPSCR